VGSAERKQIAGVGADSSGFDLYEEIIGVGKEEGSSSIYI
jgi:hypothetical protein